MERLSSLSPDMIGLIQTLTMSQDPKDRFSYKKIATESIVGNGPNKGKLVELLYRDVLSKQDLDFGEIPDSKGNLTKFKYYENIQNCIEALSKLLDSKKVKELQLVIDLRNMIVAERENFEYGFKFNIDLIEVIYNTLVMTLMELINICIYAYVDYLKDVKNIDFEFKAIKKNSLVVIKAATQVINSYKKGDWGKMMLQFKKATKGAAMESITTNSIAEEGFIKKIYGKLKAKHDDKVSVSDEVKGKVEAFYNSIYSEIESIIQSNLTKITNVEAKQRIIPLSQNVVATAGTGKKGGWKDIELHIKFSNISFEEAKNMYDDNMDVKESWYSQFDRIVELMQKEVARYLKEKYNGDVICWAFTEKIVVYLYPKHYSKYIDTAATEAYFILEDGSEVTATEAFGPVTQMIGKEIYKNLLSKEQRRFLKKILVGIGVATVTIAFIIAGLAAIRQLIYYFYTFNYGINDFIKVENEFLKEELKNNQLDPRATARISRMSSVLSGISGFIETRILKMNTAAQKNISQADKEVFSKQNLMEDVYIEEDDETTSSQIDSNVSQQLSQKNISF